jgi:hypothetical protein
MERQSRSRRSFSVKAVDAVVKANDNDLTPPDRRRRRSRSGDRFVRVAFDNCPVCYEKMDPGDRSKKVRCFFMYILYYY